MKQTKFLTVAVFSAALAFAQGPGGANGQTPPTAEQRVQRRVEGLTRFLALTDDQKARATSIFASADSQSESVRTTLRSTQQSIADSVKKNDTGAIDQLAATAGNLSGQLISIESKANAAFYAILTPEQQAKFPAGGFGFGGPGFGPGGPGMRGEFRRGNRQNQ